MHEEPSLASYASKVRDNPTCPPPIPLVAEGVLQEMASTGLAVHSWAVLKELLAARLWTTLADYKENFGFVSEPADARTFEQRRDEALQALRLFSAAPFTLQRLAELLLAPRRQYSATHKLLNGIDKLLAVSSTLPLTPRE
ncbi:unnamed protein product, partial [Phaeothamnion confervicola]